MMAKNEGQLDRVIRLVVGLILLALALWQTGGWLQIVLYILGIIALLTAATGTCWIYKLCGCSTLKKGEVKPAEPATEPEVMAAVQPEEPEEIAPEEEPTEEAPAEETPVEEPAEEVPTEETKA